jgi:radical SAM superfamily enzyme YgiQ (UPF0313 family)
MRCALVIPAWLPQDIFPSKTAGFQLNYWQPLGTLYVASSLVRAGHEVRFLNGAFLSHQEILEEVGRFRPHFAGIYATAFGWPKAETTAADIKRRDPGVFVCAGGPYPTAAQSECLSQGGAFDAAIAGEGEHTVVEMMERLDRGRDLGGVAGLIHRGPGWIEANPPRPLVANLDELPFPDRTLLGDAKPYLPPPAMYRRTPVTVMMTSRGCNRRCIYCFQMDKERGSGIRYRSVENVLQEIELCLGQGYREIKFIDDTFAADRDRATRLAEEIRRRRMDFAWFASACVNQVDRTLLRAFKEAGCWAILYGVESGVQKNLNTLRKGTTLDQVRAAVLDAQSVGLKVHTTFMFGIPGETFDEALQTIDFACELRPDMASFHAIVPFPGTELYDRASEYGTISNDLKDFTYQGSAFVPHTMTRTDISALRQQAYRRFYSRPSYLLGRVRGLKNRKDLEHARQGVKGLFWLWTRGGLFERRREGRA